MSSSLPPVPHNVPLVDMGGMLTRAWADWFQKVFVRAGGTISYTNDELAANNFVTFARMQNIGTDSLLGRDTPGIGNVEQISVGGGIEFSGSGGIRTSAFTGDVVKAAGDTVLGISNGVITFAKLAATDWPLLNSASGYQKFGTGLLIQWGVTGSIASGTNSTITFPTSFPTACRQVIAGIQGNSATVTTTTGQWGTGAYTTTGFDLYNRTSAAQTFNYIAVGY